MIETIVNMEISNIIKTDPIFLNFMFVTYAIRIYSLYS